MRRKIFSTILTFLLINASCIFIYLLIVTPSFERLKVRSITNLIQLRMEKINSTIFTVEEKTAGMAESYKYGVNSKEIIDKTLRTVPELTGAGLFLDDSTFSTYYHYNANKEIGFHNAAIKNQEYLNAPWYLELKKKLLSSNLKTAWSTVRYDNSEAHIPMVSVASTLKDYNNNIVGIAVSNMFLKDIAEICAKVKPTKHSQVIFGSIKDNYIVINTAKKNTTGEYFTPWNGNVFDLKNKPEKGSIVVNNVVLNRIKYVSFAYTLDNDMVMLVQIPRRELFNPIENSNKFLILLVTIASVGISLVILSMISNEIVLPLDIINGKIKKIQEGHFNEKIDIENDDEIGDLADSINEMTEYLQDYSKKEVTKADVSNSVFVTNMSREIKTSLNKISDSVTSLSTTELTEEQNNYTNDIKQSSEVLLKVLNDVMDFSKIESGKIVIDNTAFSVKDVIEEITHDIEPALANKNVLVKTFCEPDIPVLLIGDESKLKQVLSKLLNNAIKFTEQGEINVFAKLVEDDSEDICDDKVRVMFKITDTGIGISKENQSKIFDEFIQADNPTTRKYGGTGLGLTICSQLVSMMGGKLRLKSILGKGSTFYFDIAFEVERKLENDVTNVTDNQVETDNNVEAQMDEAEIAEICRITREMPDRKASILIVEDNFVNQTLLQKFLENLGLNCVLAQNGEVAYEMIVENNYDLIFMNCDLPTIDGYETANRIRKYEDENKLRRIPILAFSSSECYDDKEKCLQAGMDDIVVKPIDYNDFIKKLNNYLPKADVTNETIVEIEEREVSEEVAISEETSVSEDLNEVVSENCDGVEEIVSENVESNVENVEQNSEHHEEITMASVSYAS